MSAVMTLTGGQRGGLNKGVGGLLRKATTSPKVGRLGDYTPSRPTICGVDPGTERSAFVIFDGKTVVEHGILPNDELALHPLWRGRHIFCEMIASYGMAVGRDVFETCVWIGTFLECARRAGGWGVTRVFRRDIKLHLCNSARAKDSNVRQALIDRIGPQGTKRTPGPTYGVRSHEWAALAVAVYGWDQTFGRTTKHGGLPT